MDTDSGWRYWTLWPANHISGLRHVTKLQNVETREVN